MKSLEYNDDKAFHALKDTLSVLNILELTRQSGYITVRTDAFDRVLATLLLQAQGYGTNKLFRFFSRLLTAAETNYVQTKREFLAVVWPCQLLRPYIDLQRLTVITYHEALNWLLGYKESTGRMEWGVFAS